MRCDWADRIRLDGQVVPPPRQQAHREEAAAEGTAQATPPTDESPVIKARVLDTAQALTS